MIGMFLKFAPETHTMLKQCEATTSEMSRKASPPYVSLSFLLGCKNPEFTGVSLQSCTLVLVLCFIVDQNEFIAIMTGES